MLTSLTESVRVRVRKASGMCPTCHGPGMSIRAIAKEARCDQGAVFRFLKGLSISTANLDKLAAWAEKKESAR